MAVFAPTDMSDAERRQLLTEADLANATEEARRPGLGFYGSLMRPNGPKGNRLPRGKR